MAGIERKNFDSPDETRRPDKSTVAVVTVAGATAGRKVLQPGWRWSECIKPLVGTEDCGFHHLGVVVSGLLHVQHRDGSAAELGPSDVYVIEPGHDAWVIGDEPFVGVEFDNLTASLFAKESVATPDARPE